MSAFRRQANSFNDEEQRLLPDDASITPPKDTAVSKATTSSNTPKYHVSSLDFEHIVNEYSIQAIRDEWLLQSQNLDNGIRRRTSNDGKHAAAAPLKRQYQRKLLGYTGKTATRWILSAMAGLLTGLTSVLIVEITTWCVSWRSQSMQRLIVNPQKSDALVFGVFSSINLAAALASSVMCLLWAPQATGSGISQVKAYLNGVRVSQDKTTNPTVVLVVKVVGTILSVSSGLAIGMEGPLIFIGAMIGASCTKVSAVFSKYLLRYEHSSCDSCCSVGRRRSVSTAPSLTQSWLSWTTRELSHFATDGERRDFVSIGASCGFAASFGSPIGGLLFILDDVSSYFNQSLLLRMLVANTIGTFCLAIQHGDLSDYSVINLGTYHAANTSDIFFTRFTEVPLYVIVGIVGGVLGGLFCAIFMWLRRNITDKFPLRGRGMWLLLEVALVSLVTSVFLFYLPSMGWACKDRSEKSFYIVGSNGDEDFTMDEPVRNRFFCPQGQVNELGNVLFGSRIEAIKRILSDPTDFKRETLLTVGILFYVLMTLTFGTALPSGIFTPSVLIGASLGGAAGITFQEWFGTEVSPSTFALLGVAALLAGIQRSTVSLCVILVEGTGMIKVLVPSIIVVVVAKYVADNIYDKGIFEAAMERQHLPYLDQKKNKRRYDAIQVSEIMSDLPVVTVRPFERAKDLVELLDNYTHHGFPVVDPSTNKLLGLVRRDQIAALLECGVFEEDMNGSIRNPPILIRARSGMSKTPLMQWAYYINDDRYDYMLDATPPIQSHKQAPPEETAPRYSVISSDMLQSTRFTSLPTEFAVIDRNDKNLLVVSWLNPVYSWNYVNLGAVMNQGAYCVPDYMPVSKAYTLFTLLGLRHIVVLGGESGGEVVGIISRANLLPHHIHECTGL